MKIKISNYQNRLTCCIHTNYMNRKYGYVDWPEYGSSKGLGPGKHQPFKEAFLERLEDAIQSVYNVFNRIWFDKRPGQRIKVRIDRWDTWSMDNTLAHIILPMLKQLKETKHGGPYVDLKDVPKELHGKKLTKKQKDNGEVDDKHFERWDWVLDEMIWAFEQKCRDHWEEDYYGPYIESKDKRELFGRFEWTDDEGRKKHQERMSNGFRLFGKYYENLWD
jgi:hypothetical protein